MMPIYIKVRAIPGSGIRDVVDMFFMVLNDVPFSHSVTITPDRTTIIGTNVRWFTVHPVLRAWR
jgi:hypothetical protein